MQTAQPGPRPNPAPIPAPTSIFLQVMASFGNIRCSKWRHRITQNGVITLKKGFRSTGVQPGSSPAPSRPPPRPPRSPPRDKVSASLELFLEFSKTNILALLHDIKFLVPLKTRKLLLQGSECFPITGIFNKKALNKKSALFRSRESFKK